MFNRFAGIVKSMFNKGMKKLETPEVLAEQAQMELETNAKKIKEALISGITTEKSLDRQLKENAQKALEWQKRAAMALQQGNDDLAKQCLLKKQEHTQLEQNLNAQIDEQKSANAALKKRLSDAEVELRNLHTKKKELLARGKANDALASANEHLSSSPSSGASSSSSMDRWEQQILEKEARNEALRELRDEPLVDELKLLEQSGVSDVDLELAAMKAQISSRPAITYKETGSPKLIEDTHDATIVEEVEDEKK